MSFCSLKYMSFISLRKVASGGQGALVLKRTYPCEGTPYFLARKSPRSPAAAVREPFS